MGDGHAKVPTSYILSDSRELPTKLESRDAFLAVFDCQMKQTNEMVKAAISCVVQTACGETFEGSTDGWKAADNDDRAEQFAQADNLAVEEDSPRKPLD